MAAAHGNNFPQNKLLHVRVEEASGKNRGGTYVWDSEDFEGFVKAEIRGAVPKPVKATTERKKVRDHNITWNEDLFLEVPEGANELRLLLCREKVSNGKRGISVITACGIFVKDILEAVPIDKYFEMFKPGSGGEGGYIRLKMKLVDPEEATSAGNHKSRSGSDSKVGSLLKKSVLLSAIVAGGIFVKKQVDNKHLNKRE